MPFNPTAGISTKRLQSLSSQLSSHQSSSTESSEMAEKDSITCHVLDTLTGRPAANIAVTLTSPANPQVNFHASTNADGRIMNWQSAATSQPGESIQYYLGSGSGTTTWKLRFDTGTYYGQGNTFWPEVELTFYVKSGEHYHVPLLLGPYSFTTYRGS